MKRAFTAVAIVATFVAGSIIGPAIMPPAIAQVISGVVKGGGHAGAIREFYKFKTVRGNRHTTNCDREVIAIPTEYGELAYISHDLSGRVFLWYEDKEGNLRNAIIDREGVLLQVGRQSGLTTDRSPRKRVKKSR